ncbi:lytic transglycosylase, catalytic [Caballeronia hypogeia]|uniref:Lytic transglycosylase, catalytic n=1 Tax=Caballeronia hypogeia TaxID=1777140 RepID=A0A158CAI1_9BURK|nr:lytic transglycosylase domain-containing protein [Caballeronia hypogeia]SAK79282.1 lytic transglycosylase, catalytic [Caballeronia hypogeia]
MKAPKLLPMITSLLGAVPWCAGAQTLTQPLSFEKLAAECAPDVDPITLRGVVSTESSWNPYAIGVVGGRLERQPRSLAEAVATARELERQGFNFSLGLGQVNRSNFARYGERYETVFDPCRNLKAGGAILKDCFLRAKAQISDDQRALRAAFSCYYSGNFTRGFRSEKAGQSSYVQKVVANAMEAAPPIPIPVVPAVKPEGSEGPVAVHPATRPTTPMARAATAQWVIFAEGAQESDQPAASAIAGSSKGSAVKVQFMTPSAAAAPAVTETRAEQVPTSQESQAVPARRATANSASQDAPFVRFVN